MAKKKRTPPSLEAFNRISAATSYLRQLSLVERRLVLAWLTRSVNTDPESDTINDDRRLDNIVVSAGFLEGLFRRYVTALIYLRTSADTAHKLAHDRKKSVAGKRNLERDKRWVDDHARGLTLEQIARKYQTNKSVVAKGIKRYSQQSAKERLSIYDFLADLEGDVTSLIDALPDEMRALGLNATILTNLADIDGDESTAM